MRLTMSRFFKRHRIFPALVFVAFPLFAADSPVTAVQELTRQWTGLEHQNDMLQSNWRTDKPVLEQQLELLEKEARELNQLLESSTHQQDEVEKKRLDLLQQQTRFEREQAAMGRSLLLASNALQGMSLQLPPPLFKAWQDQQPRLNDPQLPVSEKLQLVLKLLGDLDDFEKKLTINDTVMTLADGKDYLVKQVYLGLSHGWYVSADDHLAASGMATAEGWQWTPTPDGAAIRQIIDILERRASPTLVSIPLQLQAPAATGAH